MIKYKKNDWDSVKATGTGSGNYVVPIGGYVCMIKDYKDNEDKSYVSFDYDIVKGEYTKFFTKKFAEDAKSKGDKAFWQGRFSAGYDEENLGRWKGLITSLERSNPGKFAWNPEAPDLSKTKNKLIGLIIGQREKAGSNGGVFLNNYVVAYKSVESIESGDFKLPEIKRLNPDDATKTVATTNNNVKNGKAPSFDDMFKPQEHEDDAPIALVDENAGFWDDADSIFPD